MSRVINNFECQAVERKSLEEYELEYLNQIVSLLVTYPVWDISRLIKYVFVCFVILPFYYVHEMHS